MPDKSNTTCTYIIDLYSSTKLNFDFPIPDYSCALQKDILVHGRMYVTENWICFYANIFRWETVVSSHSSLHSWNRTNQLLVKRRAYGAQSYTSAGCHKRKKEHKVQSSNYVERCEPELHRSVCSRLVYVLYCGFAYVLHNTFKFMSTWNMQTRAVLSSVFISTIMFYFPDIAQILADRVQMHRIFPWHCYPIGRVHSSL